jgi:predicted nucleic acid-binding protein
MIISDNSSISALLSIGKLEILQKLFGNITIPQAVLEELQNQKKGRMIAKSLDISIIGLLGILIKAKAEGIIVNLKPMLEDISMKSNFRISEDLKNYALLQAGENE